MTKLKASLIHLTLSVVAISLLFALVYFIWYPHPFFDLANTIEPFKLLVAVDVIIGPILTFVVYKKGKKTLFFDLMVIAILQISALIYGAYTIYQGRPVLLVMNQGQFHYIVDKFSNYEDLSDDLKPHLLSKPQYAYSPSQGVLDPYSDFKNYREIENFKLEVLPASLSILNMKSKFSKKEADIDALVKKYPEQELLFFILDKDTAQYYVVYSVEQKRIVDRLKF